jgi:hypothetical protein
MRLPILLSFLLGYLSMASAQETVIRQVYDVKSDTHVEVTSLFTEPSRGGYLPVRVKIANNLDSERSINLRFNSNLNNADRLQSSSSFNLSAAAGKTVTHDILVPLVSAPHSYGDQPSIDVTLSGSLGNASYPIRGSTGSGLPAVLLSESLHTPNASVLDAASSKLGGSGYRYGNHAYAGKFDPKQMPSDWLAYSGYDSLVMTDTDWSSVAPGARRAILSWLELGGQLILYSASNATPSSLGLPSRPSLGSISMQPLPSSLILDAAPLLDLTNKTNPTRWRNASIQSDYNTSWPLQAHFGNKEFNYGIFIAVLIVFGILVGPVNLFYFAKSGQRHRLFITTPIISLLASFILLALIIFQDGFGGHGIRRVFMEVRPDAGLNAAFVHQEQISRTGILLSGRFTVDPACYFVPVPIASSRWSRYTNDYNTRGTFNLQPADTKLEASGDWWQSRSEHGHAISAVVPTRGRIETTDNPNELVSTFSFPIETLYHLDSNGQWHRAEKIVTGKKFTLSPVDPTMVEPALAKEANAFCKRNQEIFNRAYRRKNHFIAITANAPGIDTLPGIRWRETQTVITGPVLGKTEAPKN